MKHVVNAAPDRQTILVTGFGPFPGAPRNPTMAIIEALAGMRPRFEQLGFRLATAVLPVVYAEVDGAVRRLVERERPDAILHLGLASRRTVISVETLGLNRVDCARPDAAGDVPPAPTLVRAGPPSLPATYDAKEIVDAIRNLGHPVRISRSAGDYVCNALLYRSLAANTASQVGFIHVPLPSDLGDAPGSTRLSLADLTNAVEAAILVMMERPPASPGPSVPKARTTDAAQGGP